MGCITNIDFCGMKVRFGKLLASGLPNRTEIHRREEWLSDLKIDWKAAKDYNSSTRKRFGQVNHWGNNHYSATAICIDFLDNLSRELRHNIRKTSINEAHPAVLLPQSHAQGLIPCEF